jgi:hypothetical protein
VKRTTRLVAALVLAVSLICAGVALAAIPNKGTYRGKTSQGRNLRVKVNSNHNLPGEGFRIHWAAPCQVQQDMEWADVTQNTKKITVADDGSFKLDAQYNHTVSGFKGHITIHAKGLFKTKTSATGSFKVKVRVTQAGEYRDTCKKTVTWSVSD